MGFNNYHGNKLGAIHAFLHRHHDRHCFLWLQLGEQVSILLQPEKLHIKQECGIGWDDTRMPNGTVRKIRRARESCSLPNAHLGHAFLPATNHFLLADLKLERLISVTRRVELLAILKSAWESKAV